MRCSLINRSVVAAVVTCFLAFAPAALAGPGSTLSPRLAKLAQPRLRAASRSRQAKALSLAAKGPGSLVRRGKRVLAYVRFEAGAQAGVGALRDAGAQIVDVSPRYQTVAVAAKPGELSRVGSVAGVAGVTEALAPVTAASCPSGEIVSEGLQQLKAGEGEGEARKEFPGIEGGGVTVGILSDSFNQATKSDDGSGPVATTEAGDVLSGDLPGEVNPCGDTTSVKVLEPDISGERPTDEGRGMAQIVHDLAPKASIDFASAFNNELAFAKNIHELAVEGARVIADDVFYFEEPFFQDGPVAVAVDEVAAAGVTYFSAAGNNNLIDAEGHDITSWETPEYRDSGSCPQVVQALPELQGTHCLDFDPGAQTDRTFGIKVEPGATLTVDLQWDEPWYGVETNLDAYLLDAGGNLIGESRENNIKKSQKPVEVIQWPNETKSERTVQLVVNRRSGFNPRVKFALVENGSGVSATEYPRTTEKDVVGPTVFGHNGASGAISVGAVPFNAAPSAKGSRPEEYSSRGPVRHDFGPVIGTEKALPLVSPEVLSKPDLAATDCGKTTFFASFVKAENVWRFCGTSAAAPHAAAVAALMLNSKPAAEPDEIRSALLASAVSVGEIGEDEPCAVGAGLVRAVGAIEDLAAPPVFTPPTCVPPSEEVSVEEARAPGDWGSETPPAPPNPPATETQLPVNPPPVEEPPRIVAPGTFFRLRPAKLIRTRQSSARVSFRFGSNKADVTFTCRIDGGLFRVCPESMTRRFGIGWHSVQVAALDPAGNGDRTPAFYRFRVKRVR
jgi:subtilisin family serine protease